jgi:uncharacterized protein (TIGR02246 family)
MSRTRTALAALGLVLSAAALRAADDPRAEVRRAVDRGNAEYIRAMKEADAAGVAAVYAADGTRFHEKGAMSRGRDAIRSDLGRFLKRTGPVTVTIDTLDLWVVDDTAYETGKWSYTFQPAGRERTRMSGRYVTVWRKQKDGAWKIHADLPVPDDPPPARKESP